MKKQKTLPCGRVRELDDLFEKKNKEEWIEKLNLFIKEKGLKNSDQRLSIAKAVLDIETHFSTKEVADLVQKKYSDIGPATVYRAISLFQEAGLLQETLVSDGGETFFEIAGASSSHHDHIVCSDCGEIFEFHDEGIESLQNKAFDEMKFIPERHRHVIYAKCGYRK